MFCAGVTGVCIAHLPMSESINNSLEALLHSTAQGRAFIAGVETRARNSENQALIEVAAQLVQTAKGLGDNTNSDNPLATDDRAKGTARTGIGARLMTIVENLQTTQEKIARICNRGVSKTHEASLFQNLDQINQHIRSLADLSETIIAEIIRGRQVMDLFSHLEATLANDAVNVPFEVSNRVHKAAALMRTSGTSNRSYAQLRQDLETLRRQCEAAIAEQANKASADGHAPLKAATQKPNERAIASEPARRTSRASLTT